MLRRLFALAVFLLSAIPVLFALSGYVAYRYYAGPGPLTQETHFIVERGSSVAAIGAGLEKQGVILSALVFRIAARLQNVEQDLKAGEYAFAPGTPVRVILDKLARGDVFLRRITIPEGLTSWQIGEILKNTEGLSGEIDTLPRDGTLLPETYTFTAGESRAAQLGKMENAMKSLLEKVWESRNKSIPVLSEAEAVILASVVEKETGVAEERRRIAGVFSNRLKMGMPLQSDPTVIYALTGGKIDDKGMGPLGRRLLSRDLQYDSPYNTYKYPGLPPGPIANPGRAAIEAVLDPETHDFLYFVADGTGGHIFARTLEEHNRNVANWRRVRAQKETGQN